MTDFKALKAYLSDFFDEFSYSHDDARVLASVYDSIVSSPEAAEHLTGCLDAYEKDYRTDYHYFLGESAKIAEIIGVHSYTTDLLVYILLSRRLWELYAERGYPREVWHRSMCDLKYKLDECRIVKGIVGSFVAGWFSGFFTLDRFGLGRLQFELVDFDREYGILMPGDKVINIHIPRDGTHIDPESCRDAYLKAKEWFRDEATDYDGKKAFRCSSWVIYPGILPALKETSNVRRFTESFDIYDVSEYQDTRDLWRLFDTDETDPDRLPADSSLRRAYIDRLRAGLPLGSGKGILFI